MTPQQVQAVVDELFALLEAQFATRPIVLVVLHTLQAAADSLVTQIVTNVNAKSK